MLMSEAMHWAGLLFIGDPHLSGRPPGFRRDDYPQVTLAKLRWALDYGHQHHLLPVLLGDLFHFPRDNANWLLVELMHMLDPAKIGGTTLAVAGNHDCRENALSPDDTLAVLAAAGRLRLLHCDDPWVGIINDVPITVGGSCWGQSLPKSFDRKTPFVFWVTHHDLRFPGYEDAARLKCFEISGVDAVINGHIHRHLDDVVAGGTTWCNPGNVSRVTRGDACRAHRPAILRIDIHSNGWSRERVELPHQPFEEAFHPDVESVDDANGSMPEFIRGLKTLQQSRTADGTGLRIFLDENLSEFDAPVADAIRRLAAEVLMEKTNGQ